MKWKKKDYFIIIWDVLFGLAFITLGFLNFGTFGLCEIFVGFSALLLACVIFIMRRKSIKMHKEFREWIEKEKQEIDNLKGQS